MSSAADILASFDFIPKDSSRETYSSSSFLPQPPPRSHLNLLIQERWQGRGEGNPARKVRRVTPAYRSASCGSRKPWPASPMQSSGCPTLHSWPSTRQRMTRLDRHPSTWSQNPGMSLMARDCGLCAWRANKEYPLVVALGCYRCGQMVKAVPRGCCLGHVNRETGNFAGVVSTGIGSKVRSNTVVFRHGTRRSNGLPRSRGGIYPGKITGLPPRMGRTPCQETQAPMR